MRDYRTEFLSQFDIHFVEDWVQATFNVSVEEANHCGSYLFKDDFNSAVQSVVDRHKFKASFNGLLEDEI